MSSIDELPPSSRRVSAAALVLTLSLAACRTSAPSTYSGFVDAPVAAVASLVSGRVVSIEVREGDRVRKGQLLARLDSREREAQLAQAQALLAQAREALAEAQANLNSVLPTVGGASADVARALATLEEAEANFGRTQKLAGGEAASAQQLDAARARLLEARATWQSLGAAKASVQGKVSTAMAAVSNARAVRATAEAAVHLAEVQVSQAQVLSPFDGLVTSRNLEEGEWAAPGTPVVSVEDRTRLWVRIDVEETALAPVELGGEAAVTVVALPGRTFRGRISEVGAEADFALNRDVKRGRPDIRTFRVRVSLDGPGDALRPGMTAEVTLHPGTGTAGTAR